MKKEFNELRRDIIHSGFCKKEKIMIRLEKSETLKREIRQDDIKALKSEYLKGVNIDLG